MSARFTSLVTKLKNHANKYDPLSNTDKVHLLQQISKHKLPVHKSLINYFEVLLFICAFPPDLSTLKLAEKEMDRITSLLKKTGLKNKSLINSGLPFTGYNSHFSHDLVSWLLSNSDCSVKLNRYEHEHFDLNEVLKLTLPSMEKAETTAGMENDQLMDTLLVKKNERLQFLINELSKLNTTPYIKDHFFDGLGIYVDLIPENKLFSRGYNRYQPDEIFYHTEILKRFDYRLLLDQEVNPPKQLSAKEKNRLITIIKNSMALTDRETDPTTYMDDQSLRLYEMERGISIAIYGMLSQRQLPLQSYVGYTLFKNGFPAAYGGGWVFGKRADFGINIFESFRGGESGYLMCQLLRLYRQVFSVDYFEVEPYQYGLDNPEGIESGAFWFYYRFGFRPLDKQLLKVANHEHHKISTRKNYRTSKKVLIGFTADNIALNLGNSIPQKHSDIIIKTIKMISTKFNGDRLKAEQGCVLQFLSMTGSKDSFNQQEYQVLKEVSLWAVAMNVTEKEKLNCLLEMVKTKPVDLYKYQALLLQFFK